MNELFVAPLFSHNNKQLWLITSFKDYAGAIETKETSYAYAIQ